MVCKIEGKYKGIEHSKLCVAQVTSFGVFYRVSFEGDLKSIFHCCGKMASWFDQTFAHSSIIQVVLILIFGFEFSVQVG